MQKILESNYVTLSEVILEKTVVRSQFPLGFYDSNWKKQYIRGAGLHLLICTAQKIASED